MKIRKTILTAAILMAAVCLPAQNKSAGINISIWKDICTQPHDSTQTTYVNIGLLSTLNRLNGVGINALGSVVHGDMNGVQITGLANLAGGTMRGVHTNNRCIFLYIFCHKPCLRFFVPDLSFLIFKYYNLCQSSIHCC